MNERLTLRCGGKGGRCGAPVLVPVSALADLETLRRMLSEVKWGLVSYEIAIGGQQIPITDPACPACDPGETRRNSEPT